MPLLLSIILPIVFLGVGLGVSIARKQADRGFILWSGLLGIGVMLVVFLIPQHLYNWYSRVEFNKVGPCGICREWSFVPYLFYWVLWGIGGGIGLVIIFIYLFRAYRLHPESFIRFPFSQGSFKKYVGLVVLSAGLLIIASYLITETQNSRLIQAIEQVSIPISGPHFEEIGKRGLPIFVGFLEIRRGYVQPDSLIFSPKGSWLELRYGKVTEIWLARTLIKSYQFSSSYGVKTSFSPDEHFLAVFTDPKGAGKLEIYQVGEASPAWQMINGTENTKYSPSFSFSVILRYYGPEKEFFSYDYQNGEFNWLIPEQKEQVPEVFYDIQEEMTSKAGEYLHSAISPDGQLAVYGWKMHLEVWDLSTRTKIGERTLDAAVTALAFSLDQKLLVIATADGYIRFFAQTAP
jgi:hypothetical protein